MIRQSLIYKTGVEYGDYTLNHVQGCSHGCTYPCYAFMMAKRFGKVNSYAEWVQPEIVENTMELLKKELPRFKEKIKLLHLCFTTDPFMYQHEEIAQLSLQILQRANAEGICCSVLTKGLLPETLTELPLDNEYGITVVSLDEGFVTQYEPGAAPIANRIAFLILRKLSKDKEIDILKDIVLFYGYASYSKAILTSLREILCEYRKMSVSASNERESFEKKIGFVSYQHNLHSKSKKMQMYFGIFEDFPGSVDEKNNLVIDEDITESVKVIQIIPISTTLSTFHTMWKSFSDAIDKDSKKSVCLYRNYTVLWVTDERKDYSQDGQLSLTEHEKKFVNSYDPNLRTAELKVSPSYESQSTTVHYYIDVESKWHDPLTCKLCFPNNPLMEIPLIETDATSTVPAQQIRYQSGHHNKPTKSPNFDVEINNRRILNLKDYISYGHIIRRQNHYQFYIDTQSYFYKTDVKEDVKEWLEGLREKDEIKEQMPGIPIMKVIISPEHNTNVGFAQYVNNYYFKGMAEVVSFNIDKQFRSNFFCEHKSLADLIDRLNNSFSKGYPVRFYFVDDTIITGETFQKSNSFLHSVSLLN